MELEHRFEVPVGIDRAWTSLLDMEQVAACFPGATLTSADGQEYTGSVKVKLGPIQLTYKGSARIVQADEEAHRATIEANGSATRSASTASMTVNATATALDAERTAVAMKTDLTITGRPAQFGRGVMVEVGNKILGQFADCLAGRLSAPAEPVAGGDEAAGAEVTGPEVGETSGDASGANGGAAADQTGGAAGGPRHAAAYTRSPEPIDLLESAGTPVLKRLAPVLGGLLALWLLRKLIRRRSTRRAAKRAARTAARAARD